MNNIKTREQWLLERKTGIGASEASAIVGASPYKSNITLWEEKTGRREPGDIGGKEYVQRGIAAEPFLRHLFALDYPQYKVGYDEFDLIRNKDYPFIFATLDGKLTDLNTYECGVLEIKKAELNNMAQRMKWSGKTIPQNYYIQVIHQLLATGWGYAYLKAKLISTDENNEIKAEIRHIKILRKNVESDIDYLLDKEIKFWEYVTSGKRPPLVLPDIG